MFPFQSSAVPRLLAATPRAGWIALAAFALAMAVLLPASRLLLPEASPLHVSDYVVTLIGKILCYSVVAVAMGLVWGYAGILSLGHGLFFSLGGYAFGMYLMRQIGRDGSYRSDLPDFMVFLDWKALPWYWQGSDSFLWALLLALLVRRHRFRVWLFRLPFAYSRRLFFHHHPGTDFRRDAVVLS